MLRCRFWRGGCLPWRRWHDAGGVSSPLFSMGSRAAPSLATQDEWLPPPSSCVWNRRGRRWGGAVTALGEPGGGAGRRSRQRSLGVAPFSGGGSVRQATAPSLVVSLEEKTTEAGRSSGGTRQVRAEVATAKVPTGQDGAQAVAAVTSWSQRRALDLHSGVQPTCAAVCSRAARLPYPGPTTVDATSLLAPSSTAGACHQQRVSQHHQAINEIDAKQWTSGKMAMPCSIVSVGSEPVLAVYAVGVEPVNEGATKEAANPADNQGDVHDPLFCDYYENFQW